MQRTLMPPVGGCEGLRIYQVARAKLGCTAQRSVRASNSDRQETGEQERVCTRRGGSLLGIRAIAFAFVAPRTGSAATTHGRG